MRFRVEESPGDVLIAAGAYLPDCNYSIEIQSEREISAATGGEFSWRTAVVCLIGGSITLYLLHLVNNRQCVELSVSDAERGTLVVTAGSDVSRILIEEWISDSFRSLTPSG